MLNRFFSLAVSVCVAASMAALGQTQGPGAEYLFQVGGVSGSQYAAYNALGNPLAPLANTMGPAGLLAVIPTPTGSKFYLVGTSTIQAVDTNFLNAHAISLSASGLDPAGLTPNITAVTMTPDGQYLLVGANDTANNSYLFIVNTNTDSAVTGSSLPIQLAATAGYLQPGLSPPCPQCFIAVSRDATTAYVLENPSSGAGALVAAYSLTSFQRISTPLSLGAAGNALTLSPQDMLYFSAGNEIAVIDPVAFAVTQKILLSGFNAGPLAFTPDGTTAYAIHQTPRQGGTASLLSFNVASNSVNWYSPSLSQQQAGPQLSAVLVGSASSVFALSSDLTTLYDVSPAAGINVSTPSPTLTQALNSNTAATSILEATISNELPAATSLFVLVANGNQPFLDRINLASDTVAVTNLTPVLQSGNMLFESIPVQTAPTAFLTFNTVQTVNPGNTSLPLIARAYGGNNGLPVNGAMGTFTTDPSTGLVVNTTNVTSNADGYVMTTVSVPAGGATCPSGVCTVTLTLGGVVTTFSVNVPGSSGGGGGGGGGGGTQSSQLTITAGQGQLVDLDNQTLTPLTVQVTDPTGLPLSGVTVNFAVTSGSGAINPASTTTDVNGMASTVYFAEPFGTGMAFETDTVVATATVGSNTFSATFYETSYEDQYSTTGSFQESGVQVSIFVLDPVSGQYVPPEGTTLQVSPGAPAQNAVQAVVNANPIYGLPGAFVPDVGVSFINNTIPGNPSPVSCQGQPLSDAADGTINCTLVTSCSVSPGIYGISIVVGGLFSKDTTVQVSKGGGGATTVTATSGNNQSGTAGQKAASPLIATVTDFCGNAVPGATVTWKVTGGSATLTQTTTTANTLGQASDTVTFGQTAGKVTITATVSTGGTATFTLTANVSISGITPVSGGGQTATTGQAFAQPLIVSVLDNNHNPVSGIQVTFNVNSGSASVNPINATTGNNGQAQTTVTAGPNAGPVVVTATITSFSTTFNLTVIPPGPSITASSFVNAASNAAGLVACGLGVVTGSGLASGIQGVISGSNGFGPLPYTLSGVSMTVNGVPAPIQAVSNQNGVQQVNFQTPCEIAGSSSATVVVTVNSVPTTIPGVQVFAAQPGVFTYPGPNNIPYAVVISAQNGEYVTPSNPAIRGQTYYAVVTGLGQTTPPMLTNNVSVAGQNVVSTMVVGVENSGVPVVSAAAYVDTFGAYLVGFQIPLNLSPGTNIAFAVAADVAGTLVFGNPTYIPAIE